MTDREFKRLSKSDLLDIIFELQKSEKELTEKNSELEEKLASKELKIANVGSIAEATVAVNGVFEAAQAAADQYLDAIKKHDYNIPENNVYVSNDDSGKSEAERIIEEARMAADEMIKKTAEQCNRMKQDTIKEINDMRNAFIKQMREAKRGQNTQI